MANSYLNRTTGSPSNADKITISAWIKRTTPGAEQVIIGEYGSSTNRSKLQFKSDDKLEYYQVDSGSATVQIRTNRLFRDTSAYYNIVMQYDSAQVTASDRLKLYVNGTQETSLSISTYPPQNQDTRLNKSGVNLHIGQDGNSGNYFEGYISHIALVDNAISAPTVFGETDSTSGIWKFKSPSGVTWGTNGFHLKFENSAALGTDSAGSNNFTVNGNLQQALDTPSNVYATLNPLHPSLNTSRAFSNGNTYVALGGTARVPEVSTLGMTSGKFYAEMKDVSGSGGASIMGITGQMRRASAVDFLGSKIYDYAYYAQSGDKINDANETSFGNSYTDGDIIGVAVDLDNLKIYFSKNGVWQNSGDPTSGSTGTGAAFTLTDPSSTVDGAYFFACSDDNQYAERRMAWNFGNGYFQTTAITSAGSNGNGSLFEYDVPSGYYALNTKNINTYG
jgi:hypothetical protein